MAIELYKQGITLDTLLVLPCDFELVMGLRELWRDLNNDDKELFFSAHLLALLATKPTERWADFCEVIKEHSGIIGRAYRHDRHYSSDSDYSLGMGLRCQWFGGETFEQVVDQALSWGDALLEKELEILNNHSALCADFVRAHNA